jgi:hypothetical protein
MYDSCLWRDLAAAAQRHLAALRARLAQLEGGIEESEGQQGEECADRRPDPQVSIISGGSGSTSPPPVPRPASLRGLRREAARLDARAALLQSVHRAVLLDAHCNVTQVGP